MARRRIRGVRRVQRRMNQALREIKDISTEAVEDVGLDLLGKAAPDAPVDEGHLRGSGYVHFGETKVAGSDEHGNVMPLAKRPRRAKPSARVGFGERYAFVQHENLEFKHPRGGRAKYLSSHFNANARRYVRHIQKKSVKPLK